MQAEKIVAFACIAGMMLLTVGCTGFQKKDAQCHPLLSYAPEARRAYMLDVETLATQPDILAVFPGEVFALIFSSIERGHPGSLRGSLLAGFTFTPEEGAFSIWVFRNAVSFTEFPETGEAQDIDGTKVLFSSENRDAWHFLPRSNVLVMGEKRSALDKALAVAGKMPLGLPELRGFLRGDNVFCGEVRARTAEEVPPPSKYEGVWLIIRPVVENLAAMQFDFSMSVTSGRASLRIAFPDKTEIEAAKALEDSARAAGGAALKTLSLHADVSKERNSAVITFNTTLEFLLELVEELYDERDEEDMEAVPELMAPRLAPRRALTPEEPQK